MTYNLHSYGKDDSQDENHLLPDEANLVLIPSPPEILIIIGLPDILTSKGLPAILISMVISLPHPHLGSIRDL